MNWHVAFVFHYFCHQKAVLHAVVVSRLLSTSKFRGHKEARFSKSHKFWPLGIAFWVINSCWKPRVGRGTNGKEILKKKSGGKCSTLPAPFSALAHTDPVQKELGSSKLHFDPKQSKRAQIHHLVKPFVGKIINLTFYEQPGDFSLAWKWSCWWKEPLELRQWLHSSFQQIWVFSRLLPGLCHQTYFFVWKFHCYLLVHSLRAVTYSMCCLGESSNGTLNFSFFLFIKRLRILCPKWWSHVKVVLIDTRYS